MGGRVGGVIVLLLALVTLLVVPRLVTPGVTGTARIDPGDPPPSVGTCILGPVYPSFEDDGAMRPLPELETVDCRSPHWGEVATVHPFIAEEGERGERIAACWTDEEVRRFLSGGGDAPEWETALAYDLTALGPDRQQFAGGQRWVACIVRGDEPFVGSLAGVVGAGNPPPTLGLCYEHGYAGSDVQPVSCRAPHGSELFAWLPLDVERPPSTDELEAQCAEVIARATGRAGLVMEPRLRLQTEVFVWFDDRQSRFVPLPLPAGARGATGFCGVLATDGGRLSTSLRQIGDAALPWTG